MISLIKRTAIDYNHEYANKFNFDITATTLQQITNKIIKVLSSWDGGNKYVSPITEYKQAHKK